MVRYITEESKQLGFMTARRPFIKKLRDFDEK